MVDGDARLGQLLRRWRVRRGLTQRQVARRVGVSSSYIALIETGRRGKRPNRELVVSLAQALDAPVLEFLQTGGVISDEDLPEIPDAPEFEDLLRRDVRLTDDQRRILIDLYRSWVVAPSSDEA